MKFMSGKQNQIGMAFLGVSSSLTRPTFFRLTEQPRFPTMTKNHVHQFYHSCIYNKEDTKKAFQRYVEVSGTIEKEEVEPIHQKFCIFPTPTLFFIKPLCFVFLTSSIHCYHYNHHQLRAAAPECFGIRDPLLPEIQHIYDAAYDFFIVFYDDQKIFPLFPIHAKNFSFLIAGAWSHCRNSRVKAIESSRIDFKSRIFRTSLSATPLR